jgi:hypothetical protein
VHRPERALERGGLSGGGGGPGTRMRAAHREVAEDMASRRGQPGRELGAERALEIRVDDEQRPRLRAARVIVRPRRRDRG